MFEWTFGEWRTVAFVAASSMLIYVSTVLAVRAGERRTLAEMSLYDFVAAVALGAIVGRTATTAAPSYVQGVTAVVTILVIHHAVSWARVRWSVVRRVVDRSPVILVRDGCVHRDRMRRAHVTNDDLATALRRHGITGTDGARLVVLESRGSFSVVPAGPGDGLDRSDPKEHTTSPSGPDAHAGPIEGVVDGTS
jgi:uncharacterized membrane protein YcaP (DUF421 family)